jgi:hypothetical protein
LDSLDYKVPNVTDQKAPAGVDRRAASRAGDSLGAGMYGRLSPA